jgi:hypothetical protein
MSYLLIGCYLAALGVYLWARPAWRHLGPPLLDSFVLGLLLFASGSVAVWFEGLANSEEVMRMGVAAGLSGTVGSSLWAYVFRSRISGFEFFRTADQLHADAGDKFAITLGLAFSTLVSVGFLIAVFSHEHIALLLRAAIMGEKGALYEARVIMSSGTEGYFAPGYVKQFRDVMVPILCMAAVLCHGTYRYRWLFYTALAVALAAVFISGQRLVVLLFALCLGSVFLMEFFSARSERFVPLKIAVPILIAIAGLAGLMTQMLGRLDNPLSPRTEMVVEKVQVVLREREGVGAVEKPKVVSLQLGTRDIAIERDGFQRGLTKIAEAHPPSSSISDTLASSGIPRPVAVLIALIHRAIIAVPRENVVTYSVWNGMSPAIGSGWTTDLSGLRPGTQTQLSNELSKTAYRSTVSSALGNSPLGLATDIYYNWGWPGVVVIPLLYALVFLWLDILLVSRNSPLLYSAKLFMFFSIPSMYSPFLFLLYGGAVVLALACYVILVRRGAFTIVGLRV